MNREGVLDFAGFPPYDPWDDWFPFVLILFSAVMLALLYAYLECP